MKQIPLNLALDTPPRLDGFVVGDNTLALAHIQQALAAPSLPQVPTYLWGESGSGKTHLLQATHAALLEQGYNVGWLDARTPCNPNQHPEFNPTWHVVLLDDVDRYNASQQHCAFNWFINALTPAIGTPRWVMAAGQWPVADLNLREDLRTRLGWGQIFALQPLDDTQTRQALHQAAQQRGLHLCSEVLDFMQSRFNRNLGSLMQLLQTLDDYALQTQRAITIPLIKQMLADTQHEDTHNP